MQIRESYRPGLYDSGSIRLPGANRHLHKSCDGHMSSRVKKCGTVFRNEGSLVQLEKVSVRLVGACLRLGPARMELLRSFLTEIRMRMEGKGEKLYDPSGSPSRKCDIRILRPRISLDRR